MGTWSLWAYELFDADPKQRITYSSTISALNRAGQWQKALRQLVGDDRSLFDCWRVRFWFRGYGHTCGVRNGFAFRVRSAGFVAGRFRLESS